MPVKPCCETVYAEALVFEILQLYSSDNYLPLRPEWARQLIRVEVNCDITILVYIYTIFVAHQISRYLCLAVSH